MSYARVLDGVATVSLPPDLLEPEDVTAEGRWWDLRQHEVDTTTWETDIIGPHGWLPIVTTPRPPDTSGNTYDYSVMSIDGVPTEVWTERPLTPEEIAMAESTANTTQLVAESDDAVDKLVAVVEALNVITDMTNASINQNVAAVLKDLARECKTIARQANREARLTSGRTEDTDTGPVTDV